MSAQSCRVELIALEQFASRYREDWARLWAATAAPPDLGPDWAECLLASRPGQRERCVVAAWFDDGGLAGVWPLSVDKQRRLGLSVVIVRPLLNLFCLHQTLLTRDSPEIAVTRALAALESGLPRWTWLEIDRLVAGEGWYEGWRALARERGLPSEESIGLTPPYLRIETSWEQFLASKSANFRSNLKRKPRRLESAGKVACSFVTLPEQMNAALAAVTDIERRSWKSTAGTAITSREWEQTFYRELVGCMAPQGRVLITLLDLEQRPVAFDLTVMAHGRAFCLKTSFDHELGDLAPGFALRARLMQRLFEQGLAEYDFLGANERYKLEWSATTRAEHSLIVFNRDWRTSLFRSLRNLAHKLRPAPTSVVAATPEAG